MFTLPLLPYDEAALEPHMSAKTLSFHYAKHHQAYVDNLNKLIADTDLEKETLEDVISKTAKQADKAAIFNNAGQHFNHTFFWQCLKPTAEKMKPGKGIVAEIEKTFGSLDTFYAEFKSAATGLFGSGWVWLVKDRGDLKIVRFANGDNPIAHDLKPLFALDVWEHAYYLDYQNRRADFVDAVLEHLINWEFIENNL